MDFINRVIYAVFLLAVGALLVPIFTLILNTMNEDIVASLPGLTEFEELIMGFLPLSLSLVVILGAIFVVRRRRR